jgi:hypothetical protein
MLKKIICKLMVYIILIDTGLFFVNLIENIKKLVSPIKRDPTIKNF